MNLSPAGDYVLKSSVVFWEVKWDSRAEEGEQGRRADFCRDGTVWVPASSVALTVSHCDPIHGALLPTVPRLNRSADFAVTITPEPANGKDYGTYFSQFAINGGLPRHFARLLLSGVLFQLQWRGLCGLNFLLITGWITSEWRKPLK